MNFKKGDTHYILCGTAKPYKIHIEAIVGGGGHVCYKYFGRYKQYWHYDVKPDYILEIEIDFCKKFLKNEKGKRNG